MDESLRLRARQARAEIRRGALRGEALRQRLLSVPFLDRDVWTDELLGIDEPPPDSAELPRGAVPYLPCEVDGILGAVREVGLRADDVFVDLGSGLGRVVLLAHLLSGARALGVEIQGALVERARACCAALALPAVSFLHADAAETEVEGSVYFLYAPFNGELLTRVLRRLEAVAQRRSITLCAISLELHGQPWLTRRETSNAALALYESNLQGG